MSAEAQFEALLDIICTSARQAITEYKKDGNTVPTIQSKTYHPIDFADDTVGLKKAVRVLEGACQQLCASLAPPQHTLQNMTLSFEAACVGVLLRAKVTDMLEKYPDGLHVDELAKLVDLEKGKLTRVLRFLSTKGCFAEVEPNVFANNRLSLVTHSRCDVSAFLRILTEDCTCNAAMLYKWMTDPDYATSSDLSKAPLVCALGQEGFKGGFFDWMEQDAERHDVRGVPPFYESGPYILEQRFHRAMTGFGHVTGSLSVLYHYPWNEVKSVCDIGASVGTVSIPLSKMYPHLKIFHHDLPDVLANAKDANHVAKIWARDAPEAVRNNQVEFVRLDFLKESPVKDQDVYYLRYITHNWPDAEAAIIMGNMRKAMAPHSRLLIHEYVLTPACRDPDTKSPNVGIAPEPLLPNFGNGSNRLYQHDWAMWAVYNAKERTLNDFIALGSATGLRLEKVYDLAESTVLEFRAV